MGDNPVRCGAKYLPNHFHAELQSKFKNPFSDLICVGTFLMIFTIFSYLHEI